MSSVFARFSSSSGLHVTTVTYQGCVFTEEGARRAAVRISAMTSLGTGSGLNPLMLFLAVMASRISNCLPIGQSLSSGCHVYQGLLLTAYHSWHHVPAWGLTKPPARGGWYHGGRDVSTRFSAPATVQTRGCDLCRPWRN